MKKSRLTKGDKREVRQEMYLTRPPRLEGKMKNLGIRPVRKQKKVRTQPRRAHKPQSYSARQRKQYQLRSKKR